MSKLICPVVRIEELLPIPQADRIVVARVLGFSCIVQKDKYIVGDLCIYVPIDSLLPEELVEKFQLEFLRKNRRVNCLKLKKVFSEGLILDNFIKARLGENVADKLGIKKWEPEEPDFQKNAQKETVAGCWAKVKEKKMTLRRFLMKAVHLTYDHYRPKRKMNQKFCKYTDIQNIKHYPNLFTEIDNVIITEKLHGSNLRCGYLPRNTSGIIDSFITKLFGEYEFVYGSHNVQKTPLSGNGFYGEDVYGQVCNKYKMSDVCKKYPHLIFFGELVGPKIQKGFEYELKELDMRIFDIKNTLTNRYLDWIQVKAICGTERIPIVPVLYEGLYDKSSVLELTQGKSTIASHIREGIVVKCSVDAHDHHVGRKILKSISPDYLLIKDKTDFH